MPHIVISVLQGMPYRQKKNLAKDIARAVSENVGIPLEMVAGEVTFEDIATENYAPAMDFSEHNPPLAVQYISFNILRGRPLEQKRKLVKDITDIVAKSIGVPADTQGIAIEINEVDPANIAHGGVLTIDMKNPPLPID
jgi:phenylpyruvate tautomerase PptA (4-oxalocrotonate tautomerase family)